MSPDSSCVLFIALGQILQASGSPESLDASASPEIQGSPINPADPAAASSGAVASNKTACNFSHEETLFLIDQYCQHKSQFENPQIKRKRIWEQIKDTVNKKFGRSLNKDQIEGRWKTLLAAYKKQKTHRNTTGKERKEFAYEAQFDIIFEGRHDIEPIGTVASMKRTYSEQKEKEQESPNEEDQQDEGEDKNGAQPKSTGKGKRLKKTKAKASGGMSCVMKFLQEHTKEQNEREEQRLEREEAMHKEKMGLMNGFLEIMKEQIAGKRNNSLN